MNKIIFRCLLSVLLLTTIHSASNAQISVNINIGTQPVWGPVGYDRADYYYLPDVESYYSVSSHQFIYLSNGRWIYASALPARYSNYDLYSGYKVVVNRPRPYLNFNQDRVQYSKFKGHNGKQQIIRDTRDVRYKQRGNSHGMPPGQAKKMENHGGDRGNGNQHNNGPGNDRGNQHGPGNNGDKGRGPGNDGDKGHGRGDDGDKGRGRKD